MDYGCELFFTVFQDQFHRHLLLEAERKQIRTIIENKSRIILVHTTSGYKYGDIYLLSYSQILEWKPIYLIIYLILLKMLNC